MAATFGHPGIESSASILYVHRYIIVRDVYEVKAYGDESVYFETLCRVRDVIFHQFLHITEFQKYFFHPVSGFLTKKCPKYLFAKFHHNMMHEIEQIPFFLLNILHLALKCIINQQCVSFSPKYA